MKKTTKQRKGEKIMNNNEIKQKLMETMKNYVGFVKRDLIDANEAIAYINGSTETLKMIGAITEEERKEYMSNFVYDVCKIVNR